jgi:DeoR family ulaG and ulaABCDEF operon transcriptional repressor
MGAAAIGPQGVMQQDIILVAAERSFIKRAETLILLIDSSKFVSISGSIVCDLSEVDVVITDKGVDRQALEMLEDAGIEVVVA